MKKDQNKQSNVGIVFDIERFATKDGPGIRTVVFLKGCALRCLWCANPESQSKEPQISFIKEKCRGCKRCISNCTNNAILTDKEFGTITEPNLCIGCSKCVDACYYNARQIIGKYMSVAEVMDIILKDKIYYDISFGGVTLSGGEPLLQIDFIEELLNECKNYGIHTAIETCGFADKQNIERALRFLDLIYFDIKSLNDKQHKFYTGQSNKKIISNFEYIQNSFHKTLVVRIPFIPQFNDNLDDIRSIFRYLSSFHNITNVEIMPFHSLGSKKYENIGLKYYYANTKSLDKNNLAYLIDIGKEYALDVIINS